jgi:N-methylhydantoinase B
VLLKRGNVITQLPSMLEEVGVSCGDRLIAMGGKGGGYGNPLERALESIAQDLTEGYITEDQLRSDYGAILDSTGIIRRLG